MKVLKKIISWPVVLTIQVLSSVALLFLLFKLGVVPTKYMIILVAVLAVLALLMYFFMKQSSKCKTIYWKNYFISIKYCFINWFCLCS